MSQPDEKPDHQIPEVFLTSRKDMRARTQRALKLARDPSEKYEALFCGAIILPRGSVWALHELAQKEGIKSPEAIAVLIKRAVEQGTLYPERALYHGAN